MVLGFLLLFFSVQESTATVKGVVTLKGERPTQTNLKPQLDRDQILKIYPNGIPYEVVETGKDNRVRWALVYVKSGFEGKSFEVPKEAVEISFDRFILKPRVLGIMPGQELRITNLSPTVHAAHILTFRSGNKGSLDSLPEKAQARRTFQEPELGIVLKDDVHPYTHSWIGVIPHPYFCVTGEKGEFEIKGLPPGKYTIEAWQENCEPTTQQIEVKDGEIKTIEFPIDLRICAHLFISGRVQGVGFRASTEEEAKKIGGLVGWVKNLPDGRVESVIQGSRENVEKLVRWCRKGPPTAEVTGVERKDESLDRSLDRQVKTFEVRY